VNQPAQQQDPPGIQSAMMPVPDCGEESYRGSGKLTGKATIITGGDSGIGRAVAIAFAREGADVLISYLSEDEDAESTAALIRDAGQRAVLARGDLSDPQHCRDIVRRAVDEFGKIDVLVSNAAYQMSHDTLDEITDEEWDYTFAVNVGAMFRLVKAALPHMPSGSSIIGSSSVNSDMPSPALAPYAATKAAKRLARTPRSGARASLQSSLPPTCSSRQTREVTFRAPGSPSLAADQSSDSVQCESSV
jgi:NADP-dependent 3-hydroxy acid dehydrogenase YdfG